MTAVDVIEVHKSYNGVAALSGVNLMVNPQECVSLLAGPGSGKSSLLRLLAGLEQVSSGEICIGGRAVTHLPPRFRNVAMVSKAAGLYPHLTVAENLGFALELRRVSKSLIGQQVRQIAADLDLSDLLSSYPKELSSADQRRVALARALIRRPEVILLDDPLSGLSFQQRSALQKLFRRALENSGATVIYASADADDALSIGGRVAVVSDGKIAQISAPTCLFEAPNSLKVAELIGREPMVQIAGRLSEDGSRFVARDGTLLSLPMAQAPDAAFGAALIFGLRAEAISHDAASPLQMTVLSVETGGTDTKLTARLAGEELICHWPGKFTASHGEQLCVRLDPSQCYIFERESGLRL